MELKELLTGVLVDTLNFTTEEASALFDADGKPIEGAKDTIISKRASQVEADKKARQKAVQEAKDSGLRQAGEKWEKRIKGLGIDLGDATGDDAAEKIREHIEALGAKSGAVDPKDEQAVKNSPFYRKMEQEYAKKHAELVQGHETKLKEVESGYQRKETLRSVREDIKAAIKELNAILPDDPKLQERQLRLVDMDLENVQFERDGDTWSLKDKEGNVIENAQGHAVKYQDFIKDIVRSNYQIAASKEKSSAGDITKGSKPSGGASGVLKKPANADEYANEAHRIRTTTTDRVERQKLLSELENLYYEKA